MGEKVEKKEMSQEDINKALDVFFRFYDEKDCGFKETRPAYEKIIGAFAKAGILPKEYTHGDDGKSLSDAEILKKVTDKCEEIDRAEVVRTGGKVKESNIGLQGFFASLQQGFSEKELEDDTVAKNLYETYKIEDEKGEVIFPKRDEKGKIILPEKAEDRLKDINMAIGEKALKALGGPGEKGDGRDQATIEAAAFLGSLAAGPYFPRQTCFSASHFMGKGSIMQIGCSQGKTSVVAMTTYEQLMAGKKVFSTSSAPGLVPENYNEARDFYEKMGIANQFCSISQNENTNEDHIVLFNREKDVDGNEVGKSTKYEIRKTEDGVKIFVEDGKKIKEVTITEELIEKLGLEHIEGKAEVDFEASIKTMMATKGIIMGDTITLGKYQDLMPDRKDGVIENSFLMVDEADAEVLDTQPQEILSKQYNDAESDKRWSMRENARDEVRKLITAKNGIENITKEDLESIVSQKLPLDFIIDAYEANKFAEKNSATNEFQYEEKDGKIFILNPNTNVMIPASQGLSQAIIANNKELAKRHSDFKEMEVLGETDIPKLFSNFDKVSLMSGTMQDKGMAELSTDEEKARYSDTRIKFFKKMRSGIGSGSKSWCYGLEVSYSKNKRRKR